MKTLFELLDDADDGQEDSEPVNLHITAGQARYLRYLVLERTPEEQRRGSKNENG